MKDGTQFPSIRLNLPLIRNIYMKAIVLSDQSFNVWYAIIAMILNVSRLSLTHPLFKCYEKQVASWSAREHFMLAL